MGTIYLEKFTLPVDWEDRMINDKILNNGGYIDNTYPCRLFSEKGLTQIDFAPITIIYGGNGSGKSTLLNLISSKLELNRIAPFNSSELYNTYVKKCKYRLGYDDEGFPYRVPNGSRIITSDDVFDYMLTVRTNNAEISECQEDAKTDHARLKYGETIKLNGMDNYEEFRLQVMARKKSVSRRKFIRKTAGEEVRLNSNGETALAYFDSHLRNDTLYCLDEPENSLSPKLQLELVKIIEEMARYCGCQFVIATHSPFLLAIESAKIYDLDTTPVDVRKWWELENTKIYYEFFNKHSQLFENGHTSLKDEKANKGTKSMVCGRVSLMQRCRQKNLSNDLILWICRQIQIMREYDEFLADGEAEEYVKIIETCHDEQEIMHQIRLRMTSFEDKNKEIKGEY